MVLAAFQEEVKRREAAAEEVSPLELLGVLKEKRE